jgi:hypothetical protein
MKKRVHPNKICGYLKPKNDALFKGFVSVNELGISEAINIILKDYFQRIPECDKFKYLNKSKLYHTRK